MEKGRKYCARVHTHTHTHTHIHLHTLAREGMHTHTHEGKVILSAKTRTTKPEGVLIAN